MRAVGCEAVSWVSDDFPGWIRVRLIDADGRAWFFVDKVPYFTSDDLTSGTDYPVPVVVECAIVARDGDVVTINTAPGGVEAEDGTTRFRVRATQLR